jgi:hypothetical protein
VSIANTAWQTTFTGDGVTTAFTFNWPIVEDSSVAVYVNGVKKTLGTDYTLVTDRLTDGVGGVVTFLVAPANGAAGLIQREPDQLQSDNLVNNQAMPPSTVMRMIDKAFTLIQQALRKFQSNDTAFTTGTLYTFAHGLGKVPDRVQVCLVCKNTDAGYAVGDVIDITGQISALGTIQRDFTNVYIRTLSAFSAVNVAHKNTFVSTAITPATNWNLRVYAS